VSFILPSSIPLRLTNRLFSIRRGAARIAVQVLKATSIHKVQRIIVITSNDRWNSAFYDVEPSELLLTSHSDLGGALKAIGGIRFAIGEQLSL